MSESSPPLVSIAILNYQRKAALRRAIAKCLEQDYPRVEVLVVDNASTDGSAEMVRRVFPEVELIVLEQNSGCAARNRGVSAANGEIVVTLDNDVLLESPGSLASIVEIFAERPALACVNFKILDQRGALSQHDWCHPRDWRRFSDEEFLTDYVLEGASAFRRNAFQETGGYWPRLFLGHEGIDLALRLLDRGHELVYSPRIAVTHLVSSEARPSSRIYYTFTRNSIWIALRHHRLAPALRSITKDMALMAFSSLRASHPGSFARGLAHGVFGSLPAIASRRPLGRETYRKLREIRRLQPSLLQKAKRHWQEQPI